MKAKYEYALAHYDYTGAERQRRFKARRKQERDAAKALAKEQAALKAQLAAEQHRKDLDAARAALGLKPPKTGKQRTAEWRERKAAKLAAEQAERDRPTPIDEIVNFTF
jgi:hypothetical protein